MLPAGGKERGGNGKDFVTAAVDESSDVSSWRFHFLLLIGLDMTRSSCYYILSCDSMLVVARCC